MKFAAFGDRYFARRKTTLCDLLLLEIDNGPLKGEKYFQPILEATPSNRVARLPDSILQGEFLFLDANDELALLAFQRQFGLIASPKIYDSHTGRGNLLFSLDEANSGIHVEASANKITVAINQFLKSGPEYPEFNHGNFVEVVSLSEVAETVHRLQSFIRATTRVKQGEGSIFDEVESERFVEIANNLRHAYYPSYGLFAEREAPNVDEVFVPLIPNLIFAHMEALTSDRPYYACEVCGRLKQYARRQPKPGEPHYCSESCRAQAKSKRQYERVKKSRTERKDSSKNDEK